MRPESCKSCKTRKTRKTKKLHKLPDPQDLIRKARSTAGSISVSHLCVRANHRLESPDVGVSRRCPEVSAMGTVCRPLKQYQTPSTHFLMRGFTALLPASL